MTTEHRRIDRPSQRAIDALRKPDASLANVPNTVRQSIADIIEEQQHQIDRYGITLMMIRDGCANPKDFAAETLNPLPKGTDREMEYLRQRREHPNE